MRTGRHASKHHDALTGKGYVLVAADMNASRSIVKMKADDDKTKVLSPHLLMTYSGEPGKRHSIRRANSNVGF